MTDRLARFTPSAAGLDRDALLFAAGRRAARASWFWKAAAGLLAASQAVTLVVLWPKAPAVAVPVEPPPAVTPVPEPEPPPASPPTDVWTAGSRPDVLQQSEPLTTAQFVPSNPPLSARSALPDL
ncbi:MAG: hypothetical protein J2P46_11900 [Zavarzinella sp.]|nr:hypothetical protein [Zavarzinella sp.]